MLHDILLGIRVLSAGGGLTTKFQKIIGIFLYYYFHLRKYHQNLPNILLVLIETIGSTSQIVNILFWTENYSS